ncbi:MAG: GAF domain-containing protein [Chloroflexi bacterium]|nr:GAF domain-containing protein [Chloroflexota bacterium]
MEYLLGLPASGALGQTCYHVFRARDQTASSACGPGCRLFRRLQAGHLKGLCRLAAGCDGRNISLLAEAMALPSGVGPRALVFAYIEGHQPAASLPLVVQDVAVLGNLATALAPQDLDIALQGALTLAREACGAESAEVFLMEPVGGQMVLAGHQGLFRQAFRQITRFAPGEGFPGLVAAQGAPVFTEDLVRDSRFLRSSVKEKGFRHYVCVPIRGPGGVVASLNIASRVSESNLTARLPLLSTMATPLGGAISMWAMRARERLRDPAPQPGLSMSENLRQLLGNLVRAMMEASCATAGGAVVWDPGSGQRLLQFAEGAAVEELGQRETCLALSQGRPISSATCSARACGRPRCWPLLCIPLVASPDTLGVVWLGPVQGNLAEGIRFGLASAMAQRAAILLSNALGYLKLHGAALQAEQKRLTRVMGWVGGTPAMATAATPVLDIRCFGPFRVLRDGAPIPASAFSRFQALAALKLLVAHRGHPVSSEALMEHLWPDADPAVALNRLHGVIHSLRQAVEPAAGPPWQVVFTQGVGYILNTSVCRVDVDVFLSGFRKGKELEKQGQCREALAAYLSAVHVYHGDFLEDEPYAEWCLEERGHLRETYLELLRRMATLLWAQGDREESIVLLRRALRVDPLLEDLHRQLMDCLHKAGRRDEALRQFETCRRVLKRELGVSPMPQTEGLYQQVLQTPSPLSKSWPANRPNHEA